MLLLVDVADFCLCYKMIDCVFYDMVCGDVFEVVFIDFNGWLIEGSFINVFVECEGILLILLFEIGLFGGILCNELIVEGCVCEVDLCVDDLKYGFFIGNFLCGLLFVWLMGL